MPQNDFSLLTDWEFIRGQSKAFVAHLGDEGLRTSLSRPGLDTPAKHFQEMVDVQKCYVQALISGMMDFSEVSENDDYSGEISAKDLISRMENADKALKSALESANMSSIEWPEEGDKSVVSHICNLIMHEALHIGQLIGLFYASGAQIPSEVIEMWALSSQDNPTR